MQHLAYFCSDELGCKNGKGKEAGNGISIFFKRYTRNYNDSFTQIMFLLSLSEFLTFLLLSIKTFNLLNFLKYEKVVID